MIFGVMERFGVARRIAAAAIVAVAAGCGGHNHLRDYDFASRSMALVYVAPPRPELVTGWYDVSAVDDPVSAVVAAGSGVAKEVVGRKARSRLDSATSLVNVDSLMSNRTLERASRFLGTRPVQDRGNADFLLEVDMHSSGIDIRGSRAAYLFMSATAVLLDARSGREIWSFDIDGRNRLTPFLYGGNRWPAGAVTAGVLSTVTVADFQRALEQLADFSSGEITDRLREALRDARN
ncbi:MAG TPA: hypothetical protein VIC03_00225 [Gemmatimonadaceae bacterium]|jgi:hypothetical protein